MSCVCEPGAETGVLPIQLMALENMEVWASCASKKNTPYNPGCNHTILEPHAPVTFPFEPISFYSYDPPHAHVRLRASHPHYTVRSEWAEIPLSTCTCTREESEKPAA